LGFGGCSLDGLLAGDGLPCLLVCCGDCDVPLALSSSDPVVELFEGVTDCHVA
jgi:hypothetical protein